MNVRLVLLRPRNAENLGAVARAMKNFGLSDWAVVDPNPKLVDDPSAKKMAVKSDELLERVRVASSLDEALGDCHWVVGTSMRRVRGKRSLTPRELASEWATRGESLALVFGSERTGLDDRELQRCHDLSAIPSRPEQPSLNLAQAVLLYCYELSLAARPADHRGKPAPRATDLEVRVLESALKDALTSGGFLTRQSGNALREMVATLTRSRLSKNEAKLWIAALKGVTRA